MSFTAFSISVNTFADIARYTVSPDNIVLAIDNSCALATVNISLATLVTLTTSSLMVLWEHNSNNAIKIFLLKLGRV